jgi:hypothetical protein
MRKKLFHLIVILGAISNAITMTIMTQNTVIVMITTALYVVLFEGIYVFLQPRLIIAERKRNLRKYPLLKKLIDTERAIVTLMSGETLYNVQFVGYNSPKEVHLIEVHLHKPKQAKKDATVETKVIDLKLLKEVRPMKK